MNFDEKFLQELNKISNVEYELDLNDKKYLLREVTITKSSTPVNKPTKRGGVYFSNTFAYKMKAITDDATIIPLLSKTMLGPNVEFGELEIQIRIKDQKTPNFKIFTNLTNSMQSNSAIELNMVIIRTETN